MNKLYELIFKNHYGFIQGHEYISRSEIADIKRLIKYPNKNYINQYENEFSKVIGTGSCVSYASGRMGFYELMRFLNIGKNDEVILLGFTCAVMVNAVIRIGAKPIFSDIDPETFGSCITSIKEKTNSKTRLIVAQHSFGIPCNIKEIKKFSHVNNIFLLEDCALSLGSSIDGKQVGNFGDAALFSTDHGKPINSLIGGFIYSQDKKLIESLNFSSKYHQDLEYKHQKRLFKRFLIERRLCNPGGYGKLIVLDAFKRIFNIDKNIFLSNDNGINTHNNYPYPAKLPSFIARIGLLEIERWVNESKLRKEILKEYLNEFHNKKGFQNLPKAYFKKNIDIIPLRFICVEENYNNYKKEINFFINTSWMWSKPIEATDINIEHFGIKDSDSILSKKFGPRTIQLPCNFARKEYFNSLKIKLKNVS